MSVFTKAFKKCCNEKSHYLSENPEAVYSICDNHYDDAFIFDSTKIICQKCERLIFDNSWVLGGLK